MSTTVTIETVEGRLHLTAPYNSDLPGRAKELSGRFDGTRKSWHFDPRDEARVRELAIDVYGTDGTTGAGDLVTIHLDSAPFASWRQLEVGGRVVIERLSRDSAPRLGHGVILASGYFASSGGSMKNPCIGEGTAVLEIKDFPRAAVPDWSEIKIVGQSIDTKALQAEREKLMDRLAAIDALLAAEPAAA